MIQNSNHGHIYVYTSILDTLQSLYHVLLVHETLGILSRKQNYGNTRFEPTGDSFPTLLLEGFVPPSCSYYHPVTTTTNYSSGCIRKTDSGGQGLGLRF